MFLGSLTDFVFPNFISQIVDTAIAKKFDEIDYILYQWIIIMTISAICGAFRDLIMGTASQRLGESLRSGLF